MNEQHEDLKDSLDLPQPQAEQAYLNNEAPGVDNPAEVASVTNIETASSGGGGILPPTAQVTQPVGSSKTDVGDPTSLTVPPTHGTPAIADDVDLIEREWVHKAKEIVERTKNDPYLQNKEMTKVKADYMKKRYNKELKLTEE